LVLQARFAMHNQTPQSVRRGREIVERALALAPGYAPAWAEKGLVHSREGEMATTTMERRRAYEQERQALTKALELDPNLAVAHARLANSDAFAFEFSAAERSAERALALDSRNRIVMGNVAGLNKSLGRLDQAIALEEMVLEIDPLHPFSYGNLAISYVVAGRLDAAEALLRKAFELWPDDAGAQETLGHIHLRRGEVTEARAAYGHLVELSGRAAHGRCFYDAIFEHVPGAARPRRRSSRSGSAPRIRLAAPGSGPGGARQTSRSPGSTGRSRRATRPRPSSNWTPIYAPCIPILAGTRSSIRSASPRTEAWGRPTPDSIRRHRPVGGCF